MTLSSLGHLWLPVADLSCPLPGLWGSLSEIDFQNAEMANIVF